MKRSILITLNLIVFSSLANAECKVNYDVIYSIASCERHKEKAVGYPYLISFNESKDAKKARNELTLNWLDRRSVDCINQDECSKQLEDIENLNISNIDIGAFQLNYLFNKFAENKDYFSIKKSYEKACGNVERHYREKKTWDWSTIARYHSKTPVHNRRYAECLIKEYSKLTKG